MFWVPSLRKGAVDYKCNISLSTALKTYTWLSIFLLDGDYVLELNCTSITECVEILSIISGNFYNFFGNTINASLEGNFTGIHPIPELLYEGIVSKSNMRSYTNSIAQERFWQQQRTSTKILVSNYSKVDKLTKRIYRKILILISGQF